MSSFGKTIVCVSMYANPLHKGHIEYLERAKLLGDTLVVIINTDKQSYIKKKSSFMNEEQRLLIIRSLRCVDFALLAFDDDETVCKTLEYIRPHIFAKGGDRYAYEIPEKKICDKLGIQIIDGLGVKVESSSRLLEKKC